MTAIILMGVIICLSVSIWGLKIGYNSDAEKFLLPGNIAPTFYDLEFYPDVDKFGGSDIKTYTGTAVITMVATENDVSSIVLNCKKPLTVSEAVLFVNGKLPCNLGCGAYDGEAEKVTFSLGSSFKKDEEFKLLISFTGEHMKEQKGFFYLPTADGYASSFLLATHLQPNNARLVYPCFDEPKYKALFKISVGIPSQFVAMGYSVLSNTEEECIEKINGKHIFRFKTTPLPMSTYLTAMTVSTYRSTPPRCINSGYLGSSNTKPKEVRIWTVPDLPDKAEVLQSFGQALFEIYTNDFGIGYGFNKVDQFMMMNSLLSSMENWGLVTYPEKLLTDYGRARAARDIAHESNHQWFGNLVTTHSWTDIWLNEAFARYFEFFGAEKINVPEMDGSIVKYSYSYVVESLQRSALHEDSYDFTHPLTIDVYEPQQLWCYFDAIEYDKGASFLRMVMHVLGYEPFYKALRHYLMANIESVSKPDDLLSAFDYVSKESESDLQGRLPSEIFRLWHLQEGYPVVQMKFQNSCTTSALLTQESFRLGDSKKFTSYKWNIPISYSTNLHCNFTDARAVLWFWKENPSLEITLGSDVKWVVVNNLETGYYRVTYPLANWMSLFEVLRNPSTMEDIHELNRAQIVDDAANLARSTSKDYLSYAFFMNLTTYLENETSYYAWMAAFNNFEYLYWMMSKNPKAYPLLNKHIVRITRKQLKALSLRSKPEDSYQQYQLRSEIVSWATRSGNNECRDEIKKVVSEVSNHTIRNYIKTLARCLEVSTGNDSLSQQLLDKYMVTYNVTEKLSIISALGCTKNENTLMKLLEISISPNETVTNTERRKIFDTIHEARPENIHLLLKFFFNNALEIYLRYGQLKNFDSLLKKLAQRLGSDEELNTLTELVTKIQKQCPMVLQCKSTVPMVLEIVKTNNIWLKKRSEAVAEWLLSEYGSE